MSFSEALTEVGASLGVAVPPDPIGLVCAERVRANEDVKEFYLGLTQVGQKSYRDLKHYKRRKRWLS